MKGYKVSIEHLFYCTQCGKKGIPIAWKKGKYREPGHLKKLYCLNCKIQINHVECVEYSDYDSEMFKKEFMSGNFQKDGSRVLPVSQWKKERAPFYWTYNERII